jgi:hypothetical protein
MRQFFASRGIEPGTPSPEDLVEPLVDATGDLPAPPEGEDPASPTVLSTLPVMDRLKLAMKGSREQREQRAVLIRDPNRIVSVAVLSSPKLSESEVEAFTRMGNVSEDVLRIIANNRSWTKNYGVVLGLVRNAKTPAAISMKMFGRAEVSGEGCQ